MTNKKRHLQTIKIHRKAVKDACFKVGLYWQGLTHDLSKYNTDEFAIYKWADGKKSPHANMRDIVGYSDRWMIHYHKNKHHWEYWLDIEDWPDRVIAIKMPYKYVIEMFCDMLGAGKAYSKEKWNQHNLLDYWKKKCEGKRLMHPSSEHLVKKLFVMLDELGEEQFYIWYKNNSKLLKENYKNDFK